MTMARRRRWLFQLALGLLFFLAQSKSLTAAHKLRGLKSGEQTSGEETDSDDTKKGKASKGASKGDPKGGRSAPAAAEEEPPEPQLKEKEKKPKGAEKGEAKDSRNAGYDYFAEACEEELIADVVNGNVIKHSQYTNFIFGYCDASEDRGPECKKELGNEGFNALPNSIKLMYIKSFCPKDIEGQVECLHGINDRGRAYEFHDELIELCDDLKTQMIRNELLRVPEGYAESDTEEEEEDDDKEEQDQAPSQQKENTSGGRDPQDDQQLVGPSNNYGYQEEDDARTPAPTPRPTPRPTRAPSPTEGTAYDHGNVGAVTPRPTSGSNTENTPAPGEWNADRPERTLPPYAVNPNNNAPRPTLPLMELNDNAARNQGNSGMSKGGIIGIIIVVFVGALVVLGLLVLRQRNIQRNRNHPIARDFYFLKTLSAIRKPFFAKGDKFKDDHQGSTLCENDRSVSSGEIDFTDAPLFGTWPLTDQDQKLGKPRSSDTLSRDHLDQDLEEEEDGNGSYNPSTCKSSLLHSFFSRTAVPKDPGGTAMTPAENAIDEIKRAISNAQWQDVYYLASKMAAEGNIDTEENLQSALVKSNENNGGGGDYLLSSSPPALSKKQRGHLNSEEAQKASQLDASLQEGDWITLAARAAVFAALEEADNPVPSSIVIPGQTAEEYLANAKAALEEAQKASAERYQRKMNADADIGVNFGANVVEEEEEEVESNSNSDSEDESDSEDDNSCEDSDDDTSRSRSSSRSSNNNHHLPGPPTLAESTNSTIPTESSQRGSVPYTSLDDGFRGPFLRDFTTGKTRPMGDPEQEADVAEARAEL